MFFIDKIVICLQLYRKITGCFRGPFYLKDINR
ncbi:hypothetical protein [Klebsiella phage Kpn74]|uniref:Uncharacterized protein n=1 Tax=Klebsiella phage Kpn74 TaxID=3044026 RepID=A0AAT9V5I9_9CAUD|nr:hypothetical protein [Klebsiella phage Kpn74]